MNERRLYALAVVGGLVAGAVLLWATTRTWTTVVVRTPGLPSDRVDVDGGTAVPLATATALVVMAGSVAVPAVRGWLRTAVGVVVTLAAAAALVTLVRAGGALDDAVRQALTESPAVAGDRAAVARLAATSDPTPWRWVALGAAVLAVLAGVAVVLRGRRWSAMGRRFESPAGATDAGADISGDGPGADGPAEASEDLWRAIDRGEDPTA